MKIRINQLIIVLFISNILAGCSLTKDKSVDENVRKEPSLEQKAYDLDTQVKKINGHYMKVANAGYSEERNPIADHQPKEVLIIDIEYENKTQKEHLLFSEDFEVFDSNGTKMASYPLYSLTELVEKGGKVKSLVSFGVSGTKTYEVFYKDDTSGEKVSWLIKFK